LIEGHPVRFQLLIIIGDDGQLMFVFIQLDVAFAAFKIKPLRIFPSSPAELRSGLPEGLLYLIISQECSSAICSLLTGVFLFTKKFVVKTSAAFRASADIGSVRSCIQKETAESPWVRKASIVSVQTTDAELKRLFPEPAFSFGKLYLFEKHYFKREKFSV